ncbi:Spherulation-specific family 4 [Boeremia exigua]|uniref:Spherulation-specific family 4 n=1 Tax=Boeremia exigua TaxID=749465 RepID=UPI001E8D4C58|nr:Spherulation-specific family 4 [Boeremia exigua]KAH6612972.1 Spherulation-specific family 4 [Boeremia exigua]
MPLGICREMLCRTLPTVTVPLYIYPGPGSWNPLHVAIATNPGLHFCIIINPSNGPGSPVPDANYIAEVARLRAPANTTLFGYVHMTWGQRDYNHVVADISTWAAWAGYPECDIHVDGIFVDEAPSSVAFLKYMKGLKQHARTVFSGNAILWTNPGVPVDSAFYAEADIINACENSHDHYTRQKLISSVPMSLRSKTSLMIHHYTRSTKQLRLDVEALLRAGYHFAFITTDVGYTYFSTMWLDFIAALASQKISCYP